MTLLFPSDAMLPWYSMIGIFLMLLSLVYFNLTRFDERFVRLAPPVYTTAGILMTFVGISLGLYHFDPADVQRSLPLFLSGMKTAFWVSVAGVASSLEIKVRYALFGIPKAFRRAEGEERGEALVRHVEGHRNESRSALGEIRMTLEQFLGRMAEGNAQALLGALEEVVRRFDTRLSGMAGESFRELSRSIESLVKWQESSLELFPRITEELARSAAQIQKLVDSQETLGRQMAHFGGAVEAQLQAIRLANEERERTEKLFAALEHFIETGRSTLPELEGKMVEMVETIGESLVRTNGEMHESLARMSRETNGQMAEVIRKTQEQVAVLDATLEQELSRALEGLGGQLAALSRRFVEDYTPLTERLREVVALAEAGSGVAGVRP